MHTSYVVNENFSCIKEITKVVHIALPSLYISNEITGVSEVLDSWKSQHIKQLQGVVVNYKNASLTSRSGSIVVDKPFIHYDVKATFELFCPSVGSIIEGKINRISREHIGCLVHKVINVSIHLSKNTTNEIWKLLLLDRTILFKVARVDFNRGFVRLKGEITEECIELTRKLYPIQNNLYGTETCVNDSNLSSSEESVQTIINDRNKSAQDVELMDTQSSFDYSIFSDDIAKQPIENDKKSKKKRKKDVDDANQKRNKKENHIANGFDTSLENDNFSYLQKEKIPDGFESNKDLNVEEFNELTSNLNACNSSESFSGNIKRDKKSKKKKKEKDADYVDHKRHKRAKHRTNEIDISLENDNNLLPKKEIAYAFESNKNPNAEGVDELMSSLTTCNSSESFLGNIKKEKKSKKKKKEKDMDDADHKRDKKIKHRTNESNISLENSNINLLPKKEIPDVSESSGGVSVEEVDELMSNLNAYSSESFLGSNKKDKKSKKKKKKDRDKEEKHGINGFNISLENSSINLLPKKETLDFSESNKNLNIEKDEELMSNLNACSSSALFIGNIKKEPLENEHDTEGIDKLATLNVFNPEFQASSTKEELIEKSKKSKKRKKDMLDIGIEKEKKSKKRKKDSADTGIEIDKKTKKRKKDSHDTGKQKKKKKKHNKDRKKSHKKDKKSE